MSISRRALLAAAASAAGLLALPHAREAGASPDPARERIRQRNLPNVPLVTHEGEPVRFYDDLVKDRVVAIHMIYTSCKTSCPLTMANLVRVHKLLAQRVGRDIFMYSITLDPKVDSVEVLRDYAKGFEVGTGWKLLTGKPGDIQNLRRRLGFLGADRETDLDKDFHTGTVRYGNEPLVFWGWVPGVAEPESIAECLLFAQASKPGEVRVAPNFTRSPSRPAPAESDSDQGHEHKHH
jgi:protein SCO1/2